MTLAEAVRAVRARHPDIANKAVVEYYPQTRKLYSYRTGAFEPVVEICAYQFMNQAGRNIATYIPDWADFGGLTWQLGLDGLGREYGPDLIEHTEDISSFWQESCCDC